MGRRIVFIVLLAAVSLWAGDPWNEKPYTDWTKEDVAVVFANSPWAHPAEFTATPGKRGELAIPYDVSHFAVRWSSARTIREAIVRFDQLAGGKRAQEAERFLQEEPDRYVIVLYNSLTSIYVPEKEELRRKCAYLEMNDSHEKIYPVAIENPETNGRKLVVLSFSRGLNNRPTIPPGRTTLRLVYKVMGIGLSDMMWFGEVPDDVIIATITAEFDLRKMVRDGKPDL